MAHPNDDGQHLANLFVVLHALVLRLARGVHHLDRLPKGRASAAQGGKRSSRCMPKAPQFPAF
jgi:hypothetical protein